MTVASGPVFAIGASIGRYTITRVLGEGGMGVVYEAMHRELGKRVAIKTLHWHYANSSEVRARFMREGQSASRIRHPHVVDVYDVAVEGETPYLVMEFLDGEDLSKLLRREGALPVQRAVDLLLPAVGAVAAAHDLGIVHRDLKPDNIFLYLERGGIQPKVVDFGISKLLDQKDAHALTGTDAVLGTPFYMSPEQAQGTKSIDARADVYALGVILFECVVGRKPFDDGTLYSLMTKIVNGDFPRPRTLVDSVPEGLEAVILRAMARNPTERYRSARALGHALLPFASERARAVLWEEFAGEAATLPAFPSTSSSPTAQDSAPNEGTSTLGQSAQQLDTARPSSRPRGWLALGATALLLSGGGIWLSSRGESPRETPPAAKKAEVAPVVTPLAQPTPVVTPRATKLVSSDPPGAAVYVDGKEVGTTPYELTLPDSGRFDLELRSPGRAPLKRTVLAGDPAELSLTLAVEQKAAKPKTSLPHAGTRPTVPSLAPR